MALGGPDPKTWVWEEALNIFTVDPTFPVVPQRSTVVGVPWLTWRVYTHLRGPSNKVPSNMIHAEGMTFFTSWYAVADASKEVEGAAAPFFTNGNKVVDSLKEDTNDVAKYSTFELASTTLGGVANLLTTQAGPLETWRDKTGHRGDDFQGTGAGAFWNALDELAHGSRDLVAQMTKDLTTWQTLQLAGGLLKRAGEVLDEGRAKWQGGERFTYDTGLGFSVSATGSELSTPSGVVRAIWQAPELIADFASHPPPKYDRESDGWPKSTFLGGVLDEGNLVPREKLEQAAKKVWQEHLKVADTNGSAVAWLLDLTYRQSLPYLPTIRPPVHLDLSRGGGPPPGSGPGSDGAGPGGGDGSTGDTGPVTTTTSSGPPPPPPPFTSIGGGGPKGGLFPPPGTPNTFLKVPTGSYVGRDGVVIGPDGKPVLGSDGRPIIVPPGSRVNGNGEIVGPRNTGNLEQKDRLRKAYPPPGTKVSGNAGESAMERYLKSLRRTPPPLPPLRAPDTMPLTMSKFDPLSNFHSGPGALGGSRIGVSSDLSSSLAPPSGGKPATTSTAGPPLGGPKSGAGSGNGVPFYPPSAGGAGGTGGAGQGKGERDRTTWLAEDEETWGTDPTVAPGVLGRRRTRTRGPGSTRITSQPQRDYTSGLGEGAATGGSTG